MLIKIGYHGYLTHYKIQIVINSFFKAYLYSKFTTMLLTMLTVVHVLFWNTSTQECDKHKELGDNLAQ